MSYYIIEPACDTSETGHVFPQIQKLKPGYDNKKEDSIYSYLKKSTNDFPNEIPNLDSFVMQNQAEATDLVSNSITRGSGLFISEKLKSILEKYNLIPHRFYRAKVVHRKKLLEGYFWFHIISDLTNLIDYPNSSFFIYKRFGLDLGDIKINSKDEYFEKISDLQANNLNEYITIKAKQILLSPAFNDRKLDIFKIGLFDTNFYISDDLKNALIENEVTGCDIQQTDRIRL